jgi:DNA-binding transcriptional LysR family regulator
LRDVFDDPLFIRVHRGVTPTPKADALAGRIRELVLRLESILSDEPFDPETGEGTLRLSANDYGQRVLLVPFIRHVRSINPRIKIALMPFEVNELGPRLMRGDIDLAITIPEMASTDLPREFLFRDQYVGVMSREHPLVGKDVSLQDFCAFDHVLLSPMGGSFESASDQELRKIGKQRNVAYSVPNFEIAMEVVRTTDVLGVLPKRLVGEVGASVASFKLPISIKAFDAIAVWHPRTTSNPLHTWCREQLSKLAASAWV